MPERWVDPGVPALRAEVCQVQGTREEMALLLGTRTDSERARLERRIVLTPSLAKQLAAALAGAAPDPNATPAGTTRSAASESDAPAAARPMLGLVRALNVGFGFEKSFKMSAGILQGDRVILGVRTALAAPRAILEICRELGMPQAHLAQLEARLPEANTAGFGFEGGARGDSFKVYLEFWERLRERLQEDPRNVEPALLFLGFKWDARGAGPGIVARYTCHPRLSVKGILRRMAPLYGDPSASAAAAREIMALAAARIARDDSFVYVEAEEQGNPRRSFDLNLYKAGLRVADLRLPLSRLCERYSIPGAQFESLLDECGTRPFGHLSGGSGRGREDFLTVYYEIEGI
jgi:hypothetical protein